MRTRNKSMRNDGRVDQSLLRGCGWKNSRFGKPGSTGQVLVRLYNLETKADCNSPLLLLVPDVPDLTHEIIAELFQSWDLKEGDIFQCCSISRYRAPTWRIHHFATQPAPDLSRQSDDGEDYVEQRYRDDGYYNVAADDGRCCCSSSR